MKTITTLLALLLATGLHAQSSDEKVFIQVEQMPEYPGGEEELLKYLSKTPYPAEAKAKRIEGTVFIRFVVEKDGKVGKVEIAKGSDEMLNTAAVAQIQKMRSWKPGRQNGKPVRVQYVIPIKFQLGDASPEGIPFFQENLNKQHPPNH